MKRIMIAGLFLMSCLGAMANTTNVWFAPQESVDTLFKAGLGSAGIKVSYYMEKSSTPTLVCLEYVKTSESKKIVYKTIPADFGKHPDGAPRTCPEVVSARKGYSPGIPYVCTIQSDEGPDVQIIFVGEATSLKKSK